MCEQLKLGHLRVKSVKTHIISLYDGVQVSHFMYEQLKLGHLRVKSVKTLIISLYDGVHV